MKQKETFKGLSEQQVLDSREKHGENVLTPVEKESIFKLFFDKFKDPIIRILLIALVASIGVSFYHYFSGHGSFSVFLEPIGVLIAILLATCVSFVFEYQANKKFEVLSQVNDEVPVKVVRSGHINEVPRREIVVGDIVVLETGDEIPADGELIETISLQINESTLTGEPVIKKTINPEHFSKESTYPSNWAMKGTSVVEGHGMMRVTHVGDATEYGKVYEGSKIDNKIKTPLDKQLDRLGKILTFASYGIATLIIVLRLVIYFSSLQGPIEWLDAGTYILNTIMIAVTLIVVAVPEGLPMSVTLSLAMSMKRMLATNNLVRKMHACETMGAATVICTDKTGTLTQNQMRIHKTDFFSANDGELSRIINEGIAVNSTAFLEESDPKNIKVLGNPTEGALLLWLKESNINYLALRERAHVIEQITFSTERKYMASLVDSPELGKKILYVKGAPEIVLSKSKTVLANSKNVPVAEYKDKIDKQLLDYQNKAMRTLGFAYKFIEDGEVVINEGILTANDLTFIGIAAISDPVRIDVPEAIQSCLSAGIDVKIVTGDTPATAKEIARQIGLWKEGDGEKNIMTGLEFAEQSDEQLLAKICDLKIMSRAKPMDKERLVKLLQQNDQVVAVTGDGTNDAPALNAAQVGLSMGDGTSVAKEASDITILDNSFSSIVRAVLWGRSLYQNIQRFILFQLTINIVACLIVLIGAFLGTDSPLTVTQMLWVNIIMDTFAALALAALPPSEKVMLEKPRDPKTHIITKGMASQIITTGLLFVVGLFGLLQYFRHNVFTSFADFSFDSYFSNFFNFSQGNELSPYELSIFFTVFVLLQFWNMFNAKAYRTGNSAFAEFIPNLKGFFVIALLIIVGQYIIVTFGGEMFSVVPLKLTDWLWIIASTSVVLWVGEILRLINKLKIEK